MDVVGCEKGAATKEGDELSLAAIEGLKFWGRGMLSGALASCQVLSEAGEGKWLSRSVEYCHKVPGMGGVGVADSGRCGMSEDGGNKVDGGRGSELSWAFKKW